MKKYKFKIKGLDCANCANELERALQKIKLIHNVSISFMTQRLVFECSSENIDEALKEIRRVIKKEEDNVDILGESFYE